MKSRYPLRPLGDVLTLDLDPVLIEPTAIYQTAGVLSYGRGLFARPAITGAETSYKQFFRIHRDQVVFSRLFAWEGAAALVLPEFDGYFVSSEFPTFTVDDEQAVPSYLGYVMRWPEFHELLAGATRGLGLRRQRVHVDEFLAIEVPLSDLEEQRRIADWLADVLDRSTRIHQAIEGARSSCDAMVPAWLQRVIGRTAGFRPLGEFGEVRRGRGPRYAHGSVRLALNQACVRDGTVDLSACREVEVDWWDQVPPEARVRSGDVLVNSTGEGTIGRSAVAPSEVIGMPFDSHVLAINTDASRLLPAFCAAFLRSPAGQTAIDAVKGANTTKQTELGKHKLESLSIPVPPISWQRQVIQALERLEGLAARLRTSTAHRKVLVDALPIAAMRQAFAGVTR